MKYAPVVVRGMGDKRFEVRLGEALRERGETIAVAESCTGGLVGSTITDVPGASEYFVGGIIPYTVRSKLHSLAVSQEALDAHGPVSRPVAAEMASHIRDRAEASWGVSTTGSAGPEGGDDQPVGTVFIGVAYAGSEPRSPFTNVGHHRFDGARYETKARIARQALRSVLDEIETVERSKGAD